ncbi:MAG: transglycosylase domain-containing protein, partial [Verrucomicrobiota bacterium]
MTEINNTRKSHGALRFLLRFFVAAGCVAGTVVALVAAWQYIVWSAKAKELDYRLLREMESASQIFDRNGELLGRIFIKNRDEKPLTSLSKYLPRAVISAEDSRFYSHGGVDFYGILRAISRNLQARRGREGASTLTQQLARNTFTEELPSKDRSIKRKILEIFVAWEVESHLAKDEILELYLNRVFFGSGFYGAEAAAQGYFGKPASELTLADAALLAGLLRSPNHLSPWRSRKACIDSRNYVLYRMRELRAISEADYQAALLEEPIVKNKRPILQESYAAAMVSGQISKLVGLENALSEGYRIYTTIDLSLQRKAEAALKKELEALERRTELQAKQSYSAFDAEYRAWRRRINAGAEEPPLKPEYLQGAAVVLDNATGAIRAIVGGRDVQHSEFNRVTQSKKPPGSAFKPLVYATAYEHGLHPWFMVQDAVMDNRKVMVGGSSGILGEWAREQSNTPFEGMVSAQNALIKSKNAATVRLGMQIRSDLKGSLEAVSSMAKAAGIQSPIRAYPASLLGSSELSLMELALAYTTFPGGGSRPAKAFLIDRVEDSKGHQLFKEAPKRENVMRPGTAYQVHEGLAAALSEGTGAKAYTTMGLKQLPFAGKTGTAYDFTDVWFSGYSSELTCGVWVGFDKPRTPIFHGAFGGDVALPIWTAIMNASVDKYPPHPFSRPQDLRRIKLCSKSGFIPLLNCQDPGLASGSASTTFDAWLTNSQIPLPEETCDVHGPKRPRRRNLSGSEEEQPRVELALDLSAIPSIALKSATVLGEDPFRSVRSEESAHALKKFKASGLAAPLDNQIPSNQTDGGPIQ